MKEEMSEFLKNLYASGAISDLHEAFEEYPVEEEWHKGNSENFLCEEKDVSYTSYEEGDIVFVKEYEYSDGKKGYEHLFVIIEINVMAVPFEIFTMLISSNLEKLKFAANKLLKKDNLNNLHKDSLVKTDKVYQISANQIEKKVGSVTKEALEEYRNNFAKRNIIYAKYLKDKEELKRDIQKGIDSANNDRLYTADEVYNEAKELLESCNPKE